MNESVATGQPLSAEHLQVWERFLRAHSSIVRRMDADMIREFGLTLTDYEVLLHLTRAEDSRLTMSKLAEHVLLTRSGMTRLVAGLCDSGYVRRVPCPNDARVCYAEITPKGSELFRRARTFHLDGVRSMFTGRFGDGELASLGELLARLPQNPQQCCDGGELSDMPCDANEG